MKMKSKLKGRMLLLVSTAAAFWMSCNRGSNPTDTPTSGTITIGVDATLQPLISAELFMFESIYTYATVTPVYSSESDIFGRLMKDSIRLVVAARELNPVEKKFFEQKKIFPRTTKVAVDAVALILHRENKDTAFTLQELSDLMKGTKTKWKELDPSSSLGDVQIVFDHSGSSTTRYMADRFSSSGKLPANCFAADSNAQVIEYVSKNPNAIGIIGLNWISDGDDERSLGFLRKINVAAIEAPDTAPGKGDFFQPYQAYLATGNYPLTRSIYIISCEGRNGLGTGFAAFVAGDKGQRIVLKSGLLPATMPVRLVKLN